MADKNRTSSRTTAPPRPTISLLPRSNGENLFTGSGAGFSPDPMTLVSNFFSDNDPDSDYRSFSQLLAGAMGSPIAFSGRRPSFLMEEDSSKERRSEDGFVEEDCNFKQNRPLNLVITQSPVFTVPPGLSPASLLDSPGSFSFGQGPFGISHQQVLAQVTAQASQFQSDRYFQAEYPSSMSAAPPTSFAQHASYSSNATTLQQMLSLTSDHKRSMVDQVESLEVPHSDQRSQPPLIVDKPADGGYNWRKYGQKQVKGSEYPRSYYKCTHPNCIVKKQVERSLDGQVTEIIYKGQHNHQKPQSSKRSKEGGNSNGSLNLQGNREFEMSFHGNSGNEIASLLKFRKDQESSQTTREQLSGSSDNEEIDDAETKVGEGDNHEPDPKRRNSEITVLEQASHRAVTEPKIIVQTTSEVDLLDDGYRWRKYGQKAVKGNPYPRSYYKCTFSGCNVRKHVERASTDPKAVITTYERKHNHDVPAAKNSSRNTANSNISQMKPQIAMVNNNQQQPMALLRLKEEGVT